MQGSGTQTDKIIKAANLIEGHQKQMVADNKQVLADNRKAIADTLRENRAGLGRAMQQNRDALNANVEQGKQALTASIDSSRRDQRAWVGVVSVQTEQGAANQDSFSFQGISLTIHNSGRTPALKLSGE